MSGVNAGPAPSKQVFLYEIPQLAAGSKIRFLGCVTSYGVENATLTLAHYYPKTLPKAAEVAVNVELVLESITKDELQVGCWLNVIGYVQRPPRKRKRQQKGSETIDNGGTTVQAVMLWNAGALNVGNYERVVEASKATLASYKKMVEGKTD
ncbi:MAG: hypothetical protein Q9160_001235 [Pyrenula sp. 1 TL-2023]